MRPFPTPTADRESRELTRHPRSWPRAQRWPQGRRAPPRDSFAAGGRMAEGAECAELRSLPGLGFHLSAHLSGQNMVPTPKCPGAFLTSPVIRHPRRCAMGLTFVLLRNRKSPGKSHASDLPLQPGSSPGPCMCQLLNVVEQICVHESFPSFPESLG